jgi:hypothetical protein
MTDTALALTDTAAAVLEQVIIKGDLARLSEADRIVYYNAVCRSIGLNPLTRPLEYIVLNGKLTLYFRRDATDQIRTLRGISVMSLTPSHTGDLLVVVATGRTPDGRQDSATGVVNAKGLYGENLANAMMKAETKAKRRLTLSLAGLGFLTAEEVEDIRADADSVAPPVQARSLADHVRQRRATVGPPTVGIAAGPSPDEDDEVTQSMGAARMEKAAGAPPTPTADLVAGLEDEIACGDEDASPMALGFCELPPGHKGHHKSDNGTWT